MAWDLMEWFMEHVGGWLLILAGLFAAVLLGVLVYGAYLEIFGPPETKITLIKSEWACTGSHNVPITTYVQSGKVMVPITSNHLECTQWSKQP